MVGTSSSWLHVDLHLPSTPHKSSQPEILRSGAPKKKGYTLPRAAMANADLARIINSTEVQLLGLPSELQFHEVHLPHSHHLSSP